MKSHLVTDEDRELFKLQHYVAIRGKTYIKVQADDKDEIGMCEHCCFHMNAIEYNRYRGGFPEILEKDTNRTLCAAHETDCDGHIFIDPRGERDEVRES